MNQLDAPKKYTTVVADTGAFERLCRNSGAKLRSAALAT
jgi:hypothetical protein